jgi:hypothetical protein
MSSFGTSGSFIINEVTNVLPAVPRGPRRFGFIADQGEITTQRDAIAEHIKAQCELVILGGDQNYGPSAGAVASNNAIWTGITQRAVIGNHDMDWDGGTAHNAHFTGRPASPGGLPNCYHETILGGLVDLIVLDSGRDSAWNSTVAGGVAVGSPMHTWVSGLVGSLTAPHRVFAFHHPPFGPVNAANRYVTDLAWDWRALGASVVLCGHTHMGWTAVKSGVRFICAGNGGRRDANLSPTLHGNITKSGQIDSFLEWASEEDYTGCILTATSSDLSFHFIDQHGRVIHGASCYAYEQDSTANSYEVIPPTGSIANGTHLVTRAAGGFHVTGVSFHAGEAVEGAEARLTVNGIPLTDWHPTGLVYSVIPVLPAWMGALVLPGHTIFCEIRNVPEVEYPPLGGLCVGLRQAFVV